jgi:hypothetical protein
MELLLSIKKKQALFRKSERELAKNEVLGGFEPPYAVLQTGA